MVSEKVVFCNIIFTRKVMEYIITLEVLQNSKDMILHFVICVALILLISINVF